MSNYLDYFKGKDDFEAGELIPLSTDDMYLMGWRDADVDKKYKESLALKTPNLEHDRPLIT
jgi:hypothetical protein